MSAGQRAPALATAQASPSALRPLPPHFSRQLLTPATSCVPGLQSCSPLLVLEGAGPGPWGQATASRAGRHCRLERGMEAEKANRRQTPP